MKKMMLIFAVLTILFTSCKKDLIENEEFPGEQINDKTMVDLTVDEDFNWKTTKDIQVNLTGATKGVVLINSAEGDNYHKGMLTSGVEYETKITVPTYVNEVQLAYDDQVYNMTLENKKINYNFN